MKKQIKVFGKENKKYLLWVTLCIILLFAGISLYKQLSSKPPTKKTVVTRTSNSSPTPLLTTPTYYPTPTFAPGQKAIYTFYIQASSRKIKPKVLGLNPSDSGKTFAVDIGTVILLKNFGIGKFHLSVSSPQHIFTDPNPGVLPASVPFGTLDVLSVFHAGFGTILVYEAT